MPVCRYLFGFCAGSWVAVLVVGYEVSIDITVEANRYGLFDVARSAFE